MIKAFLYKWVHWYFSKKALPYWIILLIDCMIVYLSTLLSCFVIHRPGYNKTRQQSRQIHYHTIN